VRVQTIADMGFVRAIMRWVWLMALSPGVHRMVGHVGALVSFQEGHALLRDLAGVDVSAKHVERAAEKLGREIATD